MMLGSPCSPCCGCARFVPSPSTFTDIVITMQWDSYYFSEKLRYRWALQDPDSYVYAASAFNGDKYSGSFQLSRIPSSSPQRWEYAFSSRAKVVCESIGTAYLFSFSLPQITEYTTTEVYKSAQELYEWNGVALSDPTGLIPLYTFVYPPYLPVSLRSGFYLSPNVGTQDNLSRTVIVSCDPAVSNPTVNVVNFSLGSSASQVQEKVSYNALPAVWPIDQDARPSITIPDLFAINQQNSGLLRIFDPQDVVSITTPSPQFTLLDLQFVP